MVNSLEVYRDTGEKQGRAFRRRDISQAQLLNRHYHEMLRLETPEDRIEAEKAFKEGYKSDFNPKPEYFR